MTWFSPTTVLKAAASSLRHAEVLRELAGFSCHTKHNKPALICIMLHFLLMFCDYTPESSFYDVIRCDIMANNEQLMYTVVYQPPLLLIILQQDKNIRQFALTGRTVSTTPPQLHPRVNISCHRLLQIDSTVSISSTSGEMFHVLCSLCATDLAAAQ